MRWTMLASLLIAVGTVMWPLSAGAASDATNVVVFLVDDMGWADLGCYGSTFHETPHIDSLRDSGMKFTDGYAACPVCSPTRASIMTGRHPVRVDITDWIPGRRVETVKHAKFKQVEDRDNLALEEITLAEAFREHGYQTFFAGKWHLGSKGHWPTDQGFDINIGGWEKGSPVGGYYAPWVNPNLKAEHEGEYLTERLTEESVKFLEERDADRPFLLYLSYYNIHTPIQAYKKQIDHYQKKAERTFEEPTPVAPEHAAKSRMREDNPKLASMVAAVDDSVGRVLAALDQLQLDDETVVVFFSDNGGLATLPNRPGPNCNLPLRSGKGWLYEGGVREPFIVRAPGVTPAGSTCDVPVVSMDIFPTILQLCGLPLKPERHVDGVSLLPLLSGGGSSATASGELADRPLFWHYPHYHGSGWTPGASIRVGDWKLIEFYHYGTVELYNLRDDPGEQRDLSQQNPAKRDELLKLLHSWQKQLDARMPEPM